MRSVGSKTQAAIDAQIFQRAVRVSLFDESGVEIPIPFDYILETPRCETDLDRTSWRMTLRVLGNAFTQANIFRGRTIKAWDVFAQGEDIELIVGFIADVKQAKDYSQGYLREALELECLGDLSRRFEAALTRYSWEPAPMNPDAANPYAPLTSERIKLTGLVRTFSMNIVSPSTTPTTTVTSWTDSNNITVASAAGFSVGDRVYVLMGRGAASPGTNEELLASATISGISGNNLTLSSWSGSSIFFIPWPGTVVTKQAFFIPLTRLPFFPSTPYGNWVKVYNSSGTLMTSGWEIARDISDPQAPVLALVFTTNPGLTFTVEVMAVDRWVILNRRKYNNAGSVVSTVPAYYLLAGVSGAAGTEKANERSATTVKVGAGYSSTSFTLTSAVGYFASNNPFSTSLPSGVTADKWISVYAADNGQECRGKIASINAGTGAVTLDASYPLRRLATGATYTPAGGEVVEFCSSTYYEILSPYVRLATYLNSSDTTSTYLDQLKHVPNGGYFLWDSDRIFASQIVYGATAPASNAGAVAPQWHLSSQAIVIDDASNRPGNDVSAALTDLLTSTGMSAGNITMGATGYTLAPFTVAQTTLGGIVEDVRSNTIPPNFRLRELENGTIVGGYITQAASPSVVLRGARKFSPRELPRPLTRVIVKGSAIEVNRAGQYSCSSSFRNSVYLFDGVKGDTSKAARVTPQGAALFNYYEAEALFKVPPCEPGRFPSVSRVVIEYGQRLYVYVAGKQTSGGTLRYLPRSFEKFSSASAGLVSSAYSENLQFIANGASVPQDSWFVSVRAANEGFAAGTDDSVTEIEIFMREGAYWEAALTDQTNKAPADGSGGASAIGKTWNVPDGTLAMSYRYVPPAWLARARAIASSASERVYTVEADGITQAQARTIAEAYLNQVLRGAELYDWEGPYDPRIQRGDTVGVQQTDGTIKALTVWGIVKERQDMRLTLADYSL